MPLKSRCCAIVGALRPAQYVNKVTKTGDCYHCSNIGAGRITEHGKHVEPSCLSCEFRPDRTFCDMPTDTLQAFEEIKTIASYPRNTTLFAEGRPVRGIYVLCDGRAKLSICSESGRRLTLRVAGPGEVLGLGAVLSNTPYEITAELLDASQVVFVRRKDLTKFLRERTDVCMHVVRMLSQDLHGAYERVRSIGMIRTRRPRTIVRPRILHGLSSGSILPRSPRFVAGSFVAGCALRRRAGDG